MTMAMPFTDYGHCVKQRLRLHGWREYEELLVKIIKGKINKPCSKAHISFNNNWQA